MSKERFENIISLLPPPYYKDDWCAIYHGDCRELLPLIPDKSVDLVLTDPPYNVGLNYCDGDNKQDYKEWCAEWFSMLPEPILLTPGVVNQALWYSIASPKWVIAWVKPNQCSPSSIGGFSTWEPIFIYGKLDKRIGIDSFVMPISTNQEHTGNHPCPKYKPAWEKLITLAVSENNIILDPFLGSGTTTYCAKKLNRYSIGIEIEEKYCEIAAKRCSQQVMELSC